MTPDEFTAAVAPYRRELAAHCYRMLGSLADAEDQVQETLLSAWRGIDGFEGRASLRSWLYRIATNGCLDVLRRRPRRLLAHERGAPWDPAVPLPASGDELWVDPAPASYADATPASPEAAFSARESVQLAFVAALQHLPPAQRGVLILRDVVGWSAAEVAALADTSVAAVNSLLQRARATLAARRGRPAEVPDRELLVRYARAWETGDLDGLIALLHDDAIVTMPPVPAWLRGRADLRVFFASRVGPPGGVQVVPVAGADEAVFAIHRSSPQEQCVPRSLHVVEFASGAIAAIHAFLDPSVLPWFVER